jgi:hypothetical protein
MHPREQDESVNDREDEPKRSPREVTRDAHKEGSVAIRTTPPPQ